MFVKQIENKNEYTFLRKKVHFQEPIHCQEGVQGNMLQVSHYEAASEAWRR